MSPVLALPPQTDSLLFVSICLQTAQSSLESPLSCPPHLTAGFGRGPTLASRGPGIPAWVQAASRSQLVTAPCALTTCSPVQGGRSLPLAAKRPAPPPCWPAWTQMSSPGETWRWDFGLRSQKTPRVSRGRRQERTGSRWGARNQPEGPPARRQWPSCPGPRRAAQPRSRPAARAGAAPSTRPIASVPTSTATWRSWGCAGPAGPPTPQVR